MDTVNSHDNASAALDQWLAHGTVPDAYLRSVLGDELRAVSPSGWADRSQEIIVVRGEVGGAIEPECTRSEEGSSTPDQQSAGCR